MWHSNNKSNQPSKTLLHWSLQYSKNIGKVSNCQSTISDGKQITVKPPYYMYVFEPHLKGLPSPSDNLLKCCQVDAYQWKQHKRRTKNQFHAVELTLTLTRSIKTITLDTARQSCPHRIHQNVCSEPTRSVPKTAKCQRVWVRCDAICAHRGIREVCACLSECLCVCINIYSHTHTHVSAWRMEVRGEVFHFARPTSEHAYTVK